MTANIADPIAAVQLGQVRQGHNGLNCMYITMAECPWKMASDLSNATTRLITKCFH